MLVQRNGFRYAKDGSAYGPQKDHNKIYYFMRGSEHGKLYNISSAKKFGGYNIRGRKNGLFFLPPYGIYYELNDKPVRIILHIS